MGIIWEGPRNINDPGAFRDQSAEEFAKRLDMSQSDTQKFVEAANTMEEIAIITKGLCRHKALLFYEID